MFGGVHVVQLSHTPLSTTVLVFRLLCGLSGFNPAGPSPGPLIIIGVNVDCNVTGGEVESVVCNYDDGAIVEDCKQSSAIKTRSFKFVFQVPLTLP